MGKRKCQPVVPMVKSRKKARQIVTQFHKINDEMALIQNSGNVHADEKKAELKR